MINIELYRGRRLRLAQQMQRGVAVIATAPERLRNRDAHYPYRFDSYFYYLTGFPEPEAVLRSSSPAIRHAACCSAATRIWSARSGTASVTDRKAAKAGLRLR